MPYKETSICDSFSKDSLGVSDSTEQVSNGISAQCSSGRTQKPPYEGIKTIHLESSEHISAISNDDLARFRASADPIRIRAPGTCGELVQGEIEGCDFLVNCPIDLFSYVTVELAPFPGLCIQNADEHTKICEAVILLAREYGLSLSHQIRVDSAIPRGKGMASSTADITAALDAVCRSCGETLAPQVLASLLAAVEPSDCVHFAGIAQVNHLTGELLDVWTVPQDIRMIVVDCGGQVDTPSASIASGPGMSTERTSLWFAASSIS
jgi:GHMP kinases N terminal domain